MVETERDSIKSTVRKLNSKRVQVVTSASIVLLQMELIVRTFAKGVRPHMVVISKLDRTTKGVIKSKEFATTQTKDMETYLKELGGGNQIKRCMTWIGNNIRT